MSTVKKQKKRTSSQQLVKPSHEPLDKPLFCKAISIVFNVQPLAQQHRSVLPCIAGEKRSQSSHREHCVVVHNDQDVFVLLLEEVVHNCHRLVAVATLGVHCEWQNLKNVDKTIVRDDRGQSNTYVVMEPLLDDLHLQRR